MNQLSPFNKLINDGEKHNVAGIIWDFADQRQLYDVNRAFRRVTQNSMVKVGEMLTMSQPAQVRKIEEVRRETVGDERPAIEILPGLFQEVETLVNDLHPHLEAHDGPRDDVLQSYWQRVVKIHNRWQEAGEGRAKETHSNRLICYLHGMKPLIAGVRAHIATGQPFADDRADPFMKLQSELDGLIVGENVASRFRDVIAERDPQNPEQIFSCLASLRESQMREMDREQRLRFVEHTRRDPGSFSPAIFRGAEGEVLGAEIIKDRILCAFWGFLRPLLNAGPLVDARAADIREWMNNEANAGVLGQVHDLRIGGFSELPIEIQRLNGLENLTCTGNNHGRLTQLPLQLLNLPNLRDLDLRNNRFREIPGIFAQWPSGYHLNLAGNPIRVLPEAIENQRGIGKREMDQLISDWVRFCNWAGIQSGNFDWLFFGLRGEFTEIPFRLWFKDTFHIPNIPFFLGALPYLLQTIILALFGISYRSTFGVICTIPGMLFAFALGAPIFILNILIDAVGLLALELVGYDRMVQIRDLPIEVEAAPAAQG